MTSSSSSPRNWRFNVFTSFHGPDVRRGFLSHLQKQFVLNGITMFDDKGIERGHIIAPALLQAIRESRISIILLSKNYASSSWCLDELLEILECKEKKEQKVMTIFYGVDPSHVRHQTGDFGMAFNETCARKSEHKRKWSEALTYVGNIAGEDFKNWDNEAEMIEKIARDVSDKLNDTPSRDFEGMVGLEGHLTEMESLLDLDNVGVKMVAISGPAGIGKSTIADALHTRLYRKFQHHCFVDNHWENFKNFVFGARGFKLGLHGQILSTMLNQNGIQINHSGVIERRLNDKKVLLTVDDVENVYQLQALPKIECLGPGSRVIVSTENKEILEQHDINDIYEVNFPSNEEARQIFCLSAFKKKSPPNEFRILVDECASICGNLPLALHVLGSSLREKSMAYWINILPWLKNNLDGRIESVLKVGYESLDEQHQVLFLLVAVFFRYESVDNVTSIISSTNRLDVSVGLENLANRYLIQINYTFDQGLRVKIHQLLEVMARQVISKQDNSKHRILVDGEEICEILESATGNRSIIEGISFDAADYKVIMHPKAFEGMRNLSFLKVYMSWQIQIPEEMEFPRRIRLFHWSEYPGKSLHRFYPENLVELNMVGSKLERLWEGRQPLANLKWMILCYSSRLKELPDLTNATNLETLDVDDCKSLEVIPTLASLTSLKDFGVERCSKLRRFPDIPHNFHTVKARDSGVEELPASLSYCSYLQFVEVRGNKNLMTFSTHLPTSVTKLDLRDCGIERITNCIKGLHNLKKLDLSRCKRLESLPELPDSLEILDLRSCKRLVSLPELPSSLEELSAIDCESLERVSGHLSTPKAKLNFANCFKLDRKARRTIIQQLFACGIGWDFLSQSDLLRTGNSGWAFLPGREVPAGFDHRATGRSLTIPHSAFNRFKACLVVMTYQKDFCNYMKRNHRRYLHAETQLPRLWFENPNTPLFRAPKHLIIFDCELPFLDPSEVSKEIELKFSSEGQDFYIIECGVQILSDETDGSNNWGFVDDFESGQASGEEEDPNFIPYSLW